MSDPKPPRPQPGPAYDGQQVNPGADYPSKGVPTIPERRDDSGIPLRRDPPPQPPQPPPEKIHRG